MARTDDAIASIKEMILSGELRPGDRLPREPDLALRLGLSRNSLREAVRALAALRVLDVRQGDGTFVTSLEPALLLDGLTFLADVHRDHAVLEVLQVRRLLEPAATALAAVSMSVDAARQLQDWVRDLPAVPDLDTLVVHDLQFHGAIAEASGNGLLCSLLGSLSSRSLRARTWRGRSQEGAVARTVHEHRKIADAVAARDAEAARAWATVHVAGVETWVEESLGAGAEH